MSKKLTSKEVKERIVKLRNFERLYPIARKKIAKLEEENKKIRSLLQLQSEIVEKLKLRIEELERMIFG